jgi:hypothetical protein
MRNTAKLRKRSGRRAISIVALIVAITFITTQLRADTGNCPGGSITLPFMDVASSPFFCQIAGAYFSGLTVGTSATTFTPSQPVSREQMTAFITRTQDTTLRRAACRAALGQWATPVGLLPTAMTTVGVGPKSVQSDGADLWVANETSDSVSRVRASDGKLLGTWTGADFAQSVLVAMGRVFVTGGLGSSSKLYMIDPTQAPGPVTTVSDSLGDDAEEMTFDGQRIWTANDNSVSIVTPGPSLPWATTTIPMSANIGGIIFDGFNIWVTNFSDNTVVKLDSNGSVIQAVPVTGLPAGSPAFDGTNLWIPAISPSAVTVVRASNGTVLATLTGNGLSDPKAGAFDGERMLFVCPNTKKISIWKATSLTPMGSFSTESNVFPTGVCSDGLNFWITLLSQVSASGKLARF